MKEDQHLKTRNYKKVTITLEDLKKAFPYDFKDQKMSYVYFSTITQTIEVELVKG